MVGIIILGIIASIVLFLTKPNHAKMINVHTEVLKQEYRIVKELNYQTDRAKEIKDPVKRRTALMIAENEKMQWLIQYTLDEAQWRRMGL